jgi:hypothetical protein
MGYEDSHDIGKGEDIEMENLNRRYRRNEDFVFRRINGESILVPISNNVGDLDSIYNLNEVGTFVWECLDGKNRLADIENLILEAFNLPPYDAETDLNDFVGQLEEIDAVFQSP